MGEEHDHQIMGWGLWYVLWVAMVEPWKLLEHLDRPRRLSKQVLHMYWYDVGIRVDAMKSSPQVRRSVEIKLIIRHSFNSRFVLVSRPIF
jgi:hypothetical protein